MTKDRNERQLGRRAFLRALGGGTAGAATAVVAGAIGAPDAAQAAENETDKKKKRYQETDHVKAYYRTNRY
jgi:hypothetical protein